MASEIQICNLALSRLGGYQIQSFNEGTKEARQCKLHYELMRDTVLEDHDWDFSRKRIELALLDETYTGWTYAYQYPTDCLIARKVLGDADEVNGVGVDETTGDPLVGESEFEVISNAALSKKVILTDKENAELVYTAKLTDCNMFSPMFINALAWRLASDLAIPLKGKAELHSSLFQQYTMELGKAKASAANQGYTKPDSSFVQARR